MSTTGNDFIEHSPETRPFWDAAAAGRFLIPRCRQCKQFHWYPRGVCPHCWSMYIEWHESAGDGEIYSFCVNRLGEPYVLAYVELTEGLRVLTNVIDADPAKLAIGTKVKVIFKPSPEQASVPLFTLS